jgi:hypothetical protein
MSNYNQCPKCKKFIIGDQCYGCGVDVNEPDISGMSGIFKDERMVDVFNTIFGKTFNKGEKNGNDQSGQ